jgi:hypothetical protein
MSAWAVVSLLLTLIVVPFAVNEAGELAPWLAGRMVQWGASLLGTQKARERYAEEWAANLERVPGKLTKLAWACGLLLWSAPRMRAQIRGRERKAMPGRRLSFRRRADNFLVTLAGGSPEFLKLVPSERVKFQSLGSAILITSSMALVSMWFALTRALGINGIAAFPVAVIWGLVIMGIDRMLIVSMPVGSRRFAIVVPRLLLALVLGTVISTPLVLRIFQTEINWELSVMAQHAASALQQHPGVHQADLLLRLQALSNLSSGNLTVEAARFLLFLLFLVIECLPVTVSLFQKPGLYERLAPTSRLD